MLKTLFNQSIIVNATNIYFILGIAWQWFKNIPEMDVSRALIRAQGHYRDDQIWAESADIFQRFLRGSHASHYVPEETKGREVD